MHPTEWTDQQRKELEAMFEVAEREKLWFFHGSVALGRFWFSPRQLRAEHEAGKFRWTAPNWTLRSPTVRLTELEKEITRLSDERNRIVTEMAK